MNAQDSKEMQHCIDNCTECHRVCLETLSYCIQQGGHHTEADHLRIMMDCVEICQTSANFMMRGSEQHHLTCRACSEICSLCAEDCASMDDDVMKKCAEVCRKCAKSCGEMSA